MAKPKELPKLPYGQGSLSWKDDTHTVIYYRKTVNMNGRQKRLFVSGTSVQEVMKLMAQEEKQYEQESQIIQNSKSAPILEDGIRQWLQLYKSQQVNNRSYDRLESIFLTHIQGSELGTMQEQAITSDDLQRFIIELKKHNQQGKATQDGLSYSSKKKVYELLNQYYNYKYVKVPHLNPMKLVTRPRKSDEEVLESNEDLVIWNDNEMLRLTEIGMQPYLNGLSGFKNGSLVIFLLWIFCRVGECQALQWKDINLEEGTVNIDKNFSRVKARSGALSGSYESKIVPTKTKNKRTVKMCKYALQAITHYKEIKKPENEDEYVCKTANGILTVTSITRTYELMIKAANLPPEKHVTIHGLRHSGISYFLRHGVPVEVVSKMAGHSSIDITQNIYYQVLESQKNKAIEDLDKYLE